MRSPFHRSTRSGSATSGSARPTFMPREDRYAATEPHFYFGWAAHGGGWLIRRQDRVTAAIEPATAANNAAHSDLLAAWDARTTLNYGG